MSTSDPIVALPFVIAALITFFALQTLVFFYTGRKALGWLREHRQMLVLAAPIIALLFLVDQGFSWGGIFLAGATIYLLGSTCLAAYLAEKIAQRREGKRQRRAR